LAQDRVIFGEQQAHETILELRILRLETPVAAIAIASPDGENRRVTGVNLQFEQCAVIAQQFDFVEPAPVMAFELDFNDLSRMLAFDGLQDFRQWQDFAGFERMPCTFVVAIVSPHGKDCSERQQTAKQNTP